MPCMACIAHQPAPEPFRTRYRPRQHLPPRVCVCVLSEPPFPLPPPGGYHGASLWFTTLCALSVALGALSYNLMAVLAEFFNFDRRAQQVQVGGGGGEGGPEQRLVGESGTFTGMEECNGVQERRKSASAGAGGGKRAPAQACLPVE